MGLAFFIAENAEKPRTARKTQNHFFLVFLTNVVVFLGVLDFSVFSVAKQTRMNSLQSAFLVG
jgi:hypothetical protein